LYINPCCWRKSNIFNITDIFKVNLPAHAVIIKNTQFYANGAMAELEDSTIFQMLGRAGRPQFDDSGVAIILTRSDKRSKYEQVVAGMQPLESKLHLHLNEHLNSEIGLGVIHDISSAMDWLRSTFFYIRLHSNPANYGGCNALNDLDSWLKQMCLQALSALQARGFTKENEGQIQLTFHGEMAVKCCLRLPTITTIQHGKAATTLKEMVCQ
jgi:ATP-dependent DNA helicase HFM1/MER3